MLFAGAKKVTFARRLSVDIDPPPQPSPGQLRLDVGGHVCNKQVIPMDGGFGGGVNGGDFRCGKIQSVHISLVTCMNIRFHYLNFMKIK